MSEISKDRVYEDFLEMTRGELEDFLAPRSLSCTGSKRELVARAFTAWELKLPIKSSYEELQVKLRVEYQRRLDLHNITDPKCYPANVWRKDVAQWPLLDLGKIFEYILENREFGNDYIGKYKIQKAFSYFKSGFVGAIECAIEPQNANTVILRARVTPSQSVRDQPRELWVAIKTNGSPLTAWCSCTAGYGTTCNHVIAVLYKIEHAIANDYHKPACTEISSRWNDQTQKQVMPMKVKDMDIRTDSRLKVTSTEERQTKKQLKQNFDPRRVGEDTVNPEAMGSFLTSLNEKSPKSVIFTGLSQQITSQLERHLPPSLTEVAEELSAKRTTETDPDVTKTFFESIEVTWDQVDKIEEASRGQSESEVWKNQRKGRITASICLQIRIQIIITMATGKNRYLWDLMAVRLASLNQTLDPWIYILLRRSFCIKARDLCKHCVSAIVKNQRTNVNNNVDGADKVDNGDQQQHQACMFSREPKCLGDNGCHPSKPDLLEVLNTGSVCSDRRNTQLPDVTETGQFPADCVCQIHIENNKQGDAPDEGLYVRFLILTKDCDRNVSSNSSNTNSRPASVNKSSSRSSNINNVVVERTAKRTDSDTGYTGASTKETQSTDVLASNHRSHTIH